MHAPIATNSSAPLPPPLGVYVHWPYCARICPYCDFNVRKARAIDAGSWRKAFRSELEVFSEFTGKRSLVSLYFGGGTPSLAPLRLIEDVISDCAELWGFEEGAEITLEANPTDAEVERFLALKEIGVNRLSLGVQAFDDARLKFLGRNHSADKAKQALDRALSIFERVSFDLIYALPGDSVALWRRALEEALMYGAGHLSLYQLTIEAGTPFANAVRREIWSPPDAEISAALYDETQDVTAAAGLPAYEVSNHAIAGQRSHHNELYWTGGDYVGIGPGAHGRLTRLGARYTTEGLPEPKAYLDAAARSRGGASAWERLDEEAGFVERILMGLRRVEGIALSPREIARLAPRIADLERDGLATFRGGQLAATTIGRRVLDSLSHYLLKDDA